MSSNETCDACENGQAPSDATESCAECPHLPAEAPKVVEGGDEPDFALLKGVEPPTMTTNAKIIIDRSTTPDANAYAHWLWERGASDVRVVEACDVAAYERRGYRLDSLDESEGFSSSNEPDWVDPDDDDATESCAECPHLPAEAPKVVEGGDEPDFALLKGVEPPSVQTVEAWKLVADLEASKCGALRLITPEGNEVDAKLSTKHAASSYGRPVLVVDGEALGTGEVDGWLLVTPTQQDEASLALAGYLLPHAGATRIRSQEHFIGAELFRKPDEGAIGAVALAVCEACPFFLPEPEAGSCSGARGEAVKRAACSVESTFVLRSPVGDLWTGRLTGKGKLALERRWRELTLEPGDLQAGWCVEGKVEPQLADSLALEGFGRLVGRDACKLCGALPQTLVCAVCGAQEESHGCKHAKPSTRYGIDGILRCSKCAYPGEGESERKGGRP